MDLISAAAVPALNQNQLGTVLGWIVLLILGLRAASGHLQGGHGGHTEVPT
jgi:hypothetical protein